jgi:hypothetical protein
MAVVLMCNVAVLMCNMGVIDMFDVFVVYVYNVDVIDLWYGCSECVK